MFKSSVSIGLDDIELLSLRNKGLGLEHCNWGLALRIYNLKLYIRSWV